jgi:hypothetical protein
MTANLEMLRIAATECARQAEKEGQRIKIEMLSIKNTAKSLEAGSDIYDQVPHISIFNIGDALNVPVKPWKQLSPQQQQKYRPIFDYFTASNEHIPESGTRLEDAPFLTSSQVATFKAANIYTLEALAGLTDTAISKLGMGIREHIKKAQSYLKVATDTAAAKAALEREESHKAEIARLQSDNQDLKRRLDALDKKLGMEVPETLKRRA